MRHFERVRLTYYNHSRTFCIDEICADMKLLEEKDFSVFEKRLECQSYQSPGQGAIDLGPFWSVLKSFLTDSVLTISSTRQIIIPKYIYVCSPPSSLRGSDCGAKNNLKKRKDCQTDLEGLWKSKCEESHSLTKKTSNMETSQISRILLVQRTLHNALTYRNIRPQIITHYFGSFMWSDTSFEDKWNLRAIK